MKVLIVGANGQIGKQLVAMIQESESLEARAMIRKPEQATFFENLGAETVVVDLEDNTDAIVEALKGIDAVVFTAGSGPSTGADKTLLIDLDGAVKTIKAAEIADVKRYIMISSFDTSREAIQEAPRSFAPYVVAKHYADEKLRTTSLDYTIIHPGILTNEKGIGKVKAASTVELGEIPREDVASVILACLKDTATIGKVFQVTTGETAIKAAIDSI